MAKKESEPVYAGSLSCVKGRVNVKRMPLTADKNKNK